MKRGKEILVFGIVFCLMMISFSFAETLEDSTTSNINIQGTATICVPDRNFWKDTSTGAQTPSFDDCFRAEGKSWDGTNDDPACCPDHYSCDILVGQCKLNLVEKLYCGDYNASINDCEDPDKGGDFKVANRTAVYFNPTHVCGVGKSWVGSDGYTYWNTTTCECNWEGNGLCRLNETIITNHYNSGVINDITSGCDRGCFDPDYCNRDECDTSGYMISRISGTVWGNYPNPSECTTMMEMKIPCESVTKLGFFDFINFIEAILIIGLVYFIYVNKNKHKK